MGMTGFDGKYFDMTVKAHLCVNRKILTADAKSAVLAELDRVMQKAEAAIFGSQAVAFA